MSRGRKPRHAIHQRLAFEAAELRRFGGLPSPEEAEGIWTSEAHSSTAIEGNTLIMSEVEALLKEGRAVGNRELKDYLEVQGYATAAQWLYSQAIRAGEWESGTLLSVQEI